MNSTNMETYMERLALSYPLRESVIQAAIRSFQIPPGSHGLDAGCGIGDITLMLAEAVGPAGHVTGLDLVPKFVTYAQNLANEAGMSKRVSFRIGDVNKLPFEDNTFDWLWSVDCVGYFPSRGAAQPQQLINELSRVVRPGGHIAVLIWSSQQLLPGFPQLEARLNATLSGTAPFTKGTKPEAHFLRVLGWFRKAGLVSTAAQTFVGTVYAPLSEAIRRAMEATLDMRWGKVQGELNQEDWAEFQRLSQPDSPDFILNLPDYYAFFTYSFFSGKVVE
ncbi:MAG: class I SAM-dependent methyltransferase [Candidatus Hodarchaeota archaeon]